MSEEFIGHFDERRIEKIEEEFNLSEERERLKKALGKGLHDIDVIFAQIEILDKEFIKRLKNIDDLFLDQDEIAGEVIFVSDLLERIDKLAGDKLNGNN